MIYAIDNDVILKAVAFGLVGQLLPERLALLGVTQYVVRRKIRQIGVKDRWMSELLEIVISHAEILEPTREEILLAAELELFAQRRALALDGGESQLCAVVILRSIDYLITGDKRAIAALEELLDSHSEVERLRDRVMCLEQLVIGALRSHDFSEMRRAICRQPNIDRVLTICFSCHREEASRREVANCLNSYCDEIRRKAARVLWSPSSSRKPRKAP